MDLPLRFPLRIDGKIVDDGPRAEMRDPWRGEVVGEIVLADAARAELAVAAAVRAFEKTRRLPSFEKKRLLQRISAAVEAESESFAELIAREAGKPIALARAEVKRAVSTLELGAEEAARMGGEVMPLDLNETSAGFAGGYTRVPAGPVIAMAPFNFPLNLVCHKLAPALASGCSIVLKPPPQAPLTALKLAELVREAGLLRARSRCSRATSPSPRTLVRDDRFATLSFTGSAKVGWHLKSIAGKKRVLARARRQRRDHRARRRRSHVGARPHAHVRLRLRRTGLHQGAALFVHEAVYDSFVSELVRARVGAAGSRSARSLRGGLVGHRRSERAEDRALGQRSPGPGSRAPRRRKAGRHPHPADRPPHRLGRPARAQGGRRGGFRPRPRCTSVSAWEDAIAQAGATRYGLQAAIFTQNLGRVRQAFEGLAVGGLIVNDSPSFRVDAMPYGGVRDSGLGREGVRFAMEEMTERKLLVIRG